ncbi:MAG: hypothetical protein ACK5KR_00640 [Breznakia sp.]
MKKIGFGLLTFCLLILSACNSSSNVKKVCSQEDEGITTEVKLSADDKEIEKIEILTKTNYKKTGLTKKEAKAKEKVFIANKNKQEASKGLSVDYKVGEKEATSSLSMDFTKLSKEELKEFTEGTMEDLDSFVKTLEDDGYTCKN